jgi:hypothetical protein
MVGYLDNDLLVPSVDTLLFIGEDTSEETRMWRFQFPERDADGKPSGTELLLPDDQLYQVVDLPGLQRILGEVATLHPLKALADPSARASPKTPTLNSLVPEIQKFLSGPPSGSVTITIKFTDDGFSLSRGNDGGVEAHFFTHPRLDAAEEEKVLALFMSMGIHPQVDYLADKGRTRVLQFTMPRNMESIVEICRILLTDVYAMRSDDTLVYARHNG